MATVICAACGEVLVRDGDLWVCAVSGDDGGTYDWCDLTDTNVHIPRKESA